MGRSRQLRRGIYLLPTMFTVGNLFCGYFSVINSIHGATATAAFLIIVAGVLDGLDGRIARLTGTTSDFGLEFDSLADLASFGIAPALLAYQWALTPLNRIGWLVGFLFLVCAAMRLARFNIRADLADKRHFAGLPSPMAAGVLACLAFAFPTPAEGWVSVVVAVLVAGVGLLMVSRLRYRSFKEFDLRNRRSYVYVLPLAAILVAVALYPAWAMLLLALAYLVSAPAAYVWGLGRRMAHRTSTPEAGTETEVADGSIPR